MYILYHCGVRNSQIQLGCRIDTNKKMAERILDAYVPTKIIFQVGIVVKKEDIPSETKIKRNLLMLRDRLKLKELIIV